MVEGTWARVLLSQGVYGSGQGEACGAPWPFFCALAKQHVQQSAPGLELQADLAPQPPAGARRPLAFLLAPIGQALAGLSEEGGGDGPGT